MNLDLGLRKEKPASLILHYKNFPTIGFSKLGSSKFLFENLCILSVFPCIAFEFVILTCFR